MPLRRLLPLVLCLVAGAAHAQGGPDRPVLDDLMRRIAAADSASLPGLAAHPATTLAGPLGPLARAWLDLAAAERARDDRGLADLADRFGRLVANHPDWGLANLGLARVAELMHGRRVATSPVYAGQMRGRHFAAYAFHLGQALQDATQLGGGSALVATQLLREEDRLQPAPVLRPLRALADRDAGDPRFDLVLARAARWDDRPDEALALVDRFLAQGGDAALGRLERARTLAVAGRPAEGAGEYLAGLAAPSAAGRALYRRDLAWVATPAELAAFDSLPTDSLQAWTTRFWALRDARELREPGERLVEHLRRWAFVYRNFRVPAADRREHVSRLFIAKTWAACVGDTLSLDDIVGIDPSRPDDDRASERVLDHRAVLYMRHGPPLRWDDFGGTPEAYDFTFESIDDRRVRERELALQSILPQATTTNRTSASAFDRGAQPGSGTPAAMPDFTVGSRNQVWLYLINGEPRLYFLAGSGVMGMEQAGTLYLNTRPDAHTLARLLEGVPMEPGERSALLQDIASGREPPGTQSYNKALRRQAIMSYFCSPQGQAWQATIREDAVVAATTDSHHRRFEGAIAASARAFALGQPEAGTGRLLVAVAMDQRSLVPGRSRTGRDAFDVALDVATIDSRTADVLRRRASLQFLPDAAKPVDRAAVTMPLPPGHREVRIQLSQDSTRGALVETAVEAARVGPSVAASDIVVGTDGSDFTADLDGRRVPVSPTGAFLRHSTLALYYELYNLQPGRTYRSRLTLRPAEPDAQAAASVSYTDEASGPVLVLERRLTLPDIKPGRYVLELVVEDGAGGPAALRRQSIRILKD